MSWAHVQSATDTFDLLQVTFASNVTQGNLIIVAILVVDAGSGLGTITSVTDTLGNTYTDIGLSQTYGGGTRRQNIFYARNISGGANTVTVGLTTGHCYIGIHEYSGVALTGPLDQTQRATATDASPTSPNVTTTENNELLFATISTIQARTITAGAGFTPRVNPFATGRDQLKTEDKNGSPAGSFAATGSLDTSAEWSVLFATFKPFSPVVGTAGDFDPELKVQAWF